jgi:hypothetical protein
VAAFDLGGQGGGNGGYSQGSSQTYSSGGGGGGGGVRIGRPERAQEISSFDLGNFVIFEITCTSFLCLET